MQLECHSTAWEWFLLFYFTIRLVVVHGKVSVSRQVYLHVVHHLVHDTKAVPVSHKEGWQDQAYNVLPEKCVVVIDKPMEVNVNIVEVSESSTVNEVSEDLYLQPLHVQLHHDG